LLTIVDSFIQHTLYPTFTGIDVSTQQKMLRLPRAINYFLDNPILGYGSPRFIYFNLMQTDDIPSPLIYFLSGGIFLGCLYLYIIYHIITQTYKFSRMLSITKEEKNLLFFLSIAFLAGFIPLLSNWQEAHFMSMFILFISICKVYVLNQTTPPQ
jgi:O-antigen ligase